MVITIRLAVPYSYVLGKKEITMEFEGTTQITFQEVIEKFIDQYPKVKELIPSTSHLFGIYGNLVPIKEGKAISLDEKIVDGDVLIFYGSLSGG